MKLVLFLGAGFSVPFGYPVMDAFLGFADGSDRLTAEDKSLLGLLTLEARRANSFLESSPTNLEDILTFSEMGERLQLSAPSERRSDRLKAIVQRVYTSFPTQGEFWPRYGTLKKLLGSSPREFDGDLTFITTNYDLNIECACAYLSSPVSLGFEVNRALPGFVHVVGQLCQKDGIPLYKLHGSVNWYPSDDATGVTVEDRIVAMQGRGDSSLPWVVTRDYTAPRTPLIVPPSFLKPELPPALKVAWQGAAKALSEATVVAFVGYSFPSSDTEMMYFLARALSENASLRRILVIDPRADSIVARLRQPASKTGSHFRDLLEPYNAPWQELASPFPARR